jgi:hypothetical protein
MGRLWEENMMAGVGVGEASSRNSVKFEWWVGMSQQEEEQAGAPFRVQLQTKKAGTG